MKILNPSEISLLSERATTERGARVIINRLFRAQDESLKWPVRGRFNATERAIRRVCAIERANGALSSFEYCYAVDGEISRIVNSAC